MGANIQPQLLSQRPFFDHLMIVCKNGKERSGSLHRVDDSISDQLEVLLFSYALFVYNLECGQCPLSKVSLPVFRGF